jgi:protein SCO1
MFPSATISLLLMVPMALSAATPAASRLAVIRPAPDFSLTDQSGKTVRMANLKGKVLLVSFVFTTCTGSCPATTLRMSLVEQELKKRGLLKDDRVRLLSITLDPERDRPEVLRDYMRQYEADPADWSFLTGPPEQVNKTVAAWGMWAKSAPGGQLDHPSRIFLVDRRGRIREVYNLAFLRPRWVVEDIALLLGEPNPD